MVGFLLVVYFSSGKEQKWLQNWYNALQCKYGIEVAAKPWHIEQNFPYDMCLGVMGGLLIGTTFPWAAPIFCSSGAAGVMAKSTEGEGGKTKPSLKCWEVTEIRKYKPTICRMPVVTASSKF